MSTLRYYDDIGLAPASCRRARVRHYDHRGLGRLVLVHLWRQDGALGLRRTAEVMRSTDHEPRNTLLRRSRDELAERIRKLQEAHDLLSHILGCQEDDYNDCPVITEYLDGRIRASFTGGAARPDPAWPELRRVAESMPGPLDGRT